MKYIVEKGFAYPSEEEFENFDDIFQNFKSEDYHYAFRIKEECSKKYVTEDFLKYMRNKGFVFGLEIAKEIDEKIIELIAGDLNSMYFAFIYEGKKGVLYRPELTQYQEDAQLLFKNGYVLIGYYDEHRIFCERKNPNSPVYEYKSSEEKLPAENFSQLKENSTVLSENINVFMSKIEEYDIEEEDFPEIENLPERDRINHFGEFIVDYKGESYPMLRFSLRGETFCYVAKWIAEKINEEQDFESDILKEITAFVDGEDYDALRELLFKTSDWNKIWKFCVRRGILCNFICYYFLDKTEKFGGNEYPIVKFDYNGMGYVYTTEDACNNVDFLEYLEDRAFWTTEATTEENIKKIGDFLATGRLYSEFDKFCKENNIENIIEEPGINDRGFEFDIDEDKDEEPPLPDGYSEEGEETLEVSEEEYKTLSQTLDRFLTGENPRWQKDTEVGEALAEFIDKTKMHCVCGYVTIDIKRESIDWHELCRNNNALVHEQYRNVTKFQNVLRDANMCSNSLYTDILNIKELAVEKICDFSKRTFLKKCDNVISKLYPEAELQKADFELRGRYKIEGIGKPVLDRISFTSIENAFDAIYVTDIKPPFKVLDTESGEDVTDKVMQVAEKEDYVFIDSEEIIKVLPKSFEEFKRIELSLKYIGYKDGKQISCMNSLNFKNIIGFKNLWAKNCVPFGYKRNFVLFVDLNQSECPVYRIDYRKTADFESRKLLCCSAEEFMNSFSYDVSR